MTQKKKINNNSELLLQGGILHIVANNTAGQESTIGIKF